MNKEEITSAETKIALSTEELHEIKTEYAKQQCIAFGKFIAERDGDQQMTLVDHNWYLEEDDEGEVILTEEELYDQFIASQNK